MSPIETLESRRLYAFGTIITGYGTGGSGTAPTIGGSDNGNAEAITVDGGKTLVAVGGGLTRFNTNGTIDASFGTNGITGFRGVRFVDDAVDSSGRIYALVTGTSGTLVQRYTASGRLDSTYATNGTTVVATASAFTAHAIDVQSDGKVVVAGNFVTSGGSTVTRVYRLTTSGAIDTGFGSNSIAEFKLGQNDLILPVVDDTVVDLKVLSSGQIEILGSSFNSDGNGVGNSLLALARLSSGGTLVSSFGTGGVARRPTFDNSNPADGSAGVIRTDGSAVGTGSQVDVFGNFVGRTAYVGFATNGRASFITYVTSAKQQSPADATALSDGRTAFVSGNGDAFFISPAGVLSNVITPVTNVSGANAIVATSTDDLILVDVASPLVRVTEIDAGRARDARPDNLPASAAIDTAVDAQGGLHVAYYDTASKSLKYAYRNAQGYWGGIRTVDATVGAGAAISIDTTQVKGRTNVGIAYYDASSADLRIASSNTNGRRFGITTVASKKSVGQSPSFHYTDAGGFAVTYYSRSTKSLYYALSTRRGFDVEVVDDGGAGAYNELQFDPDTRRPGIVYTKGTDVWYAFKGKGATWADSRTKVTATSAGAAFVNLAIPNSVAYYGGPKISYYDLASADLVLARYDRYAAAGKRWGTQIIASRGVVGAYNDITGPYQDATLFAWSKSGDTAYEYDYSSGNTTATPTPLATGGGQFLSVATDTSGNAYAIAYKDTASGLTFVR